MASSTANPQHSLTFVGNHSTSASRINSSRSNDLTIRPVWPALEQSRFILFQKRQNSQGGGYLIFCLANKLCRNVFFPTER